MLLLDRIGVDDPVGASAVHGVGGIWGVIAVGLFADNPIPLETTKGRMGLFKGGGWYLLGVQVLSVLCLVCWSVCTTFFLLYIVDKIIAIRMDPQEELLGADLLEHRIRHTQIGLSRAISALAPIKVDLNEIIGLQPVGVNPGHERTINQLHAAEDKLRQWQLYLDQVGKSKPSKYGNDCNGTLEVKKSNIDFQTPVRHRSISNLFSRRIKSVQVKNNADYKTRTILSGSYKPNNHDLPIVSNKLTKDENFAWVD